MCFPFLLNNAHQRNKTNQATERERETKSAKEEHHHSCIIIETKSEREEKMCSCTRENISIYSLLFSYTYECKEHYFLKRKNQCFCLKTNQQIRDREREREREMQRREVISKETAKHWDLVDRSLECAWTETTINVHERSRKRRTRLIRDGGGGGSG